MFLLTTSNTIKRLISYYHLRKQYLIEMFKNVDAFECSTTKGYKKRRVCNDKYVPLTNSLS